MKRKPAKGKTTAEQITSAERDALRERATLRRLKQQQRAITRGSRDLMRAVRRADAARLAMVTELVTGTEYALIVKRDHRELSAELADLRALVEEQRQQLKRVGDPVFGEKV